VLSLNSSHISGYTRTNTSVLAPLLSSENASTYANGIFIWPKYVGNVFSVRVNDDSSDSATAVTNTQGLHLATRTASNVKKYRHNTTQILSNTTASSALNVASIYIGASRNNANYSTHQTAFNTIGDGLTDTEAANLYTRVQTFNQALSRQVGVPIVSDADAQAFLNSAEITNVTEANAINTLVTDLKAQGLWTKMKAVYPFVGGTASTHKYNLKDPRDLDAAYRLVFNGGWTHSSTGALPNGTNGYADTKLVPSSVFSTSTLVHLSYYSRTNSAVNSEYVMGSINTGTGLIGMIARRDTNTQLFAADFPSGTTFRVASDTNSTNGSGYFVGTQQANNIKMFRNNTLAVSNSTVTANTTISTLPLIIGGLDLNGVKTFFTNKQTAFSTIGDGLTDTEATALYNAVNTYQVALSRNV
jgi:hypothetical protein